MRDEFSASVKDILAKRVGFRCSNPKCRFPTSGPQETPDKAINLGVASHITAASPGGPRYDNTLTLEERESTENGIWLCQTCSKLIDNDEKRYSVDKLLAWKKQAEQEALKEIEGRQGTQINSRSMVFIKLETLMPDLLTEMRNDLKENPLRREFVLLKKEWSYWAKGNELVYYYNEHPDLDDKIKILENNNLVYENIYNNTNTKRYNLTEEFVEYLTN